MDLKTILKLVGTGLLLLFIGAGLGAYFVPEKIVTKDKIIEKEVTKIVHEKFDPITGKVVERTTTDETKNTTETKTKTETLKSKKYYAVKVGAFKSVTTSDSIKPRVGVEVAVPFFELFLGAETDISTKPTVGLYLREAF
jgi:hypothetical protein